MKRWVSLMLGIVFVLMSACSNAGNQPNNKESAANADNQSNAASDKPLVIQFGNHIDVNNANVIKLKEATGETWEDNRWTRLFKEELNVETKYKLTAPAGQYGQKLKLAIASDDLPDIFSIPNGNLTDFKQLAEGGALLELGPIYEQHASPLLKSIMESEGKAVFDPMTFGGKVYGIPIKMPSTNGYNHLWIREDWLNKLNLERPTTIDDVYNIAKAFAEDDPDGNNKKDTIGITMNKDFLSSWGGMAGLFWAYGAYPDFWLKDSEDKVTYGSIQPAMKEPLKLLARLYQEGLTDREFGTKDFTKENEFVVSGKAGMFYGPHWFASFADNSQKNDPNAKWIAVPLPTVDGVDMFIPLTNSIDGVYVVRTGFEHPEKLVEMLNLYVETLFGEDADLSKWWTEGDIDFVWQTGPVYTLNPSLDLEAHIQMKDAIAAGTTDQLTGVAKGFYESIQKGSSQMNMMFGPTDTPFEYVSKTYPERILWNQWQSAPTPAQVNTGSSLNELVITSFTAMIMGKEDVDSGFEKFVKQWNALGGEQVLKEINEAKSNL